MSGLELRTERLALRPASADGLDDYAAVYADPEVVRFIGDGTVADREDRPPGSSGRCAATSATSGSTGGG